MTRTIHYVLSSHWDREWYQTFQDYRARLVHLMDRTIDAIETGELRGPFTCDGQAIVLDDYLEIRTHRREQVQQLARDGKLIIGPWFVLPDEWLVSGESILRNIRLGRQMARSYGAEPSAAGFVCDLFGHIGQMPQILAGFGVRAGLVWRGIEPRKEAHLIWRGPDGTRLPCYRFGRTGYCDYSYDVRHSHEHDVEFDRERATADLKKYVEREAARTSIPPVLLFDGGDHLEFDGQHYDVLMSTKLEGFEVTHTSLDAYLNEMLDHADKITDVFEGEMREVGKLPLYEDKHWLIPGVLSSRVWIKQWNARCQTLLCHWAEPVATMAHAWLGREFPSDFLNVAWRWLMTNHPHDSICGCSIDEVHEDMKYRFAQCEQIAQRQTVEAMQAISAALPGEVGAHELRVTLFNPLPRPLDETLEVTLQIPTEWPGFNEFFGFEPKPAFHVFAGEAEVPYQRLAQDMDRTKTRIYATKYPLPYKTNNVTIALRVQLPPIGFRALTVRAAPEQKPYEEEGPGIIPTRWPVKPGLATSERSMENEHLAITIENNGSLSLIDKRSKHTYERLLTFEDIADIGDGWYHGQAVNDQAFVSSASRSDVALLHDGPELCRFRVRTTMSVPREFDAARHRRADVFNELIIDSTVTLRRNADRIEVRTSIDNNVRDHRVRVLLPSGAADAQTYLADGAFDVVERAIALPQDNHRYREMAVETRPQQSWTAVSNKHRGLAVISSGLLETTVRDDRDRTLALTLFRSTRRTILTDTQPGGQLLGPMTFDYWIVPFAGEAPRTRLCELGTLLAAGVRDVQQRAIDVTLHRTGNLSPQGNSLLSLEGDAVLTSLRCVGDAVEVRIFNPNTSNSHIQLAGGLFDCLHEVSRVNFESNVLASEAVKSGTVALTLSPKQIITLRT